MFKSCFVLYMYNGQALYCCYFVILQSVISLVVAYLTY